MELWKRIIRPQRNKCKIALKKKEKKLLVTAVLRDCELCGKFIFIFRKKFYLSRKNSVTKFATSQSRETLVYLNKHRADNKNIHDF